MKYFMTLPKYLIHFIKIYQKIKNLFHIFINLNLEYNFIYIITLNLIFIVVIDLKNIIKVVMD